MKLNEAILNIQSVNEDARKLSQQQWSSIAKPLKSLGLLEEVVARIAGIQGTPNVTIDKRCVVIMCADNGVVAQGVTQCEQEITAIVSENFGKNLTSVCHMAKVVNADVIPIDIGIYRDICYDKVVNKKVMYGTNDMTKMPAMAIEQTVNAIEIGINMVIDLHKNGYQIIATGEMGIGNTTTSAAITSVLLSMPVESVTGIGAGLSTEGLKRKVNAIKKAIEVNKPIQNDPLDILSKIGGLDIAGLVGVFLGGAVCKIPIIIDGVISSISALVATKLCAKSVEYMIPSHVSKEISGKLLLDELGLKPLINCEMCLGEGTGAVAVISLIDMAMSVYNFTSTFEDVSIKKYEELK